MSLSSEGRVGDSGVRRSEVSAGKLLEQERNPSLCVSSAGVIGLPSTTEISGENRHEDEEEDGAMFNEGAGWLSGITVTVSGERNARPQVLSPDESAVRHVATRSTSMIAVTVAGGAVVLTFTFNSRGAVSVLNATLSVLCVPEVDSEDFRLPCASAPSTRTPEWSVRFTVTSSTRDTCPVCSA